jgi:lipopolysaccharide transport system ATP-binding protein
VSHQAVVAIKADGLGKRYAVGTRRRGYDTLRESVTRSARRTLNTVRGRARPESPEATVWALHDMSMTIGAGEVVGLIGNNGAGKSTLLKILSRITEPTCGWVEVTGRVGSLLEVGTGFHPELTGRENIFLNGAILGMRRSEIRRRFDEIVAFSEIERFLDTPVKRYSSGMSVRLAFAVAAHLEPEILLVDEVLAVGDAAFQRKSLGKMGEVAQEGRTVLFVSHNLGLIQALCRRGILLDQGAVVADAPITETIDVYMQSLERAATTDLLERGDRDHRGWQQTFIRGVEVRDAVSGYTDLVVGGRPVHVTVLVTDVLPMMECRLTIVNSHGHPVATLDSQVAAPVDVRTPSQDPRIDCDIADLPLSPGRYRIDVVVMARRQIQDGLQAAAFFEVEPGVVGGRPMPSSVTDGDVVLQHTWRLPS